MTSAHKTAGILILAGAVAAGALFFSPATRAPNEAPLTAPSATAAGLRLSVHPESDYVLTGANENHLAVTLEAPAAAEEAARPALNLAVVLDRSGSMHGKKLRQAKAAARELIGKLQPRDRFSVVAYGSDVRVVLSTRRATERAVAEAVRAIETIYDDGGTNLSGGLTAGREQILGGEEGRRGAPAPDHGGVARIVLISDGRANEGIIDRDRLAEMARRTAGMGISITTLGVGLDFDEELMTELAVSGRGNYYFAESASMLSRLFDRELERVGATVATDAVLSVEPADGVEVLDAYGYPVQRRGDRVSVPIADLHAGEQRKVVLRLQTRAPGEGRLDLARVRLDFSEPQSSQRHRAEVLARADATSERRLVDAHRNPEAVRHVERARTARAIDRATSLYERGDRDEAVRVLEERKEEAHSAALAVGADDLAEEVDEAADAAEGFMKAAPEPSSEEGRRGLKKSRKTSYDLKF